jgi:predicted nucleic acid-binding protein
MILVDASVLIDALQGRDPKLPGLFQQLSVAITGVTAAEVLHGARDPGHFQNLKAALAAFPWIPSDDKLWDVLAENLFKLRTSGVTVPFQDVVVATIAIQNDLELWARDVQFGYVQKVLPALKLFQEPP